MPDREDQPVSCEWCGMRPVTWIYPAVSMPVPSSASASLGEWPACDDCHNLIQELDWEAVFETSVMTFVARYPKLRNLSLAEVMHLCNVILRLFQMARSGPPTRVQP